MSISIRVERKFSKLQKESLDKAKKQFYREVAATLPNVIRDNYSKGISPVLGINRFQQYSKSYVDQIEGRVAFKTIKGKVVPFRPELKVIRNDLYGASPSKKGTFNKGANSKISFAQGFQKGLGVGKLKSPVNLKVTGTMWDSLKASVADDGVTIYFDSKIAKYHNGDGRVDRHILPKNGETFSRLIVQKLKDQLKAALIDIFGDRDG